MTEPELVLEYDGSFAGFLCACADSTRRGEPYPRLVRRASAPGLFEERLSAAKDGAEAASAWRGLVAASGRNAARRVMSAFLSELPGADELAAKAYRTLIAGSAIDIADPESLAFEKAAIRAGKEAERFMGLVRLSELSDGSWYSRIEPACDVLPLIADHFSSRFAPMRFAIHDSKRDRAIVHLPGAQWTIVGGFGLEGPACEIAGSLTGDSPGVPLAGASPDGLSPTEVSPNGREAARNERARRELFSASEYEARALWARYFESIAIRERTNPRLQTSKVPKKHRLCLPEFAPTDAQAK